MKTSKHETRIFYPKKKLHLQRIAKIVSEAYGAGVTYHEAQAICGAAWGDYLESKDEEVAGLA